MIFNFLKYIGLSCIRLLCKLDQKEVKILKLMVKKGEKLLKAKEKMLLEREEKIRKSIKKKLEFFDLFNNRIY